MTNERRDGRHEKLALAALVTALLVGWAGSALFYDWLVAGSTTIGLGFPVLLLVLVAGTLIVARMMQVPLRLRVLWLLIPITFFAAMAAVRAETLITYLNIGMVLALGGLAVHYLPLKKAPDQDNNVQHVVTVVFVGIYAALGALFELFWVRTALRHLRWNSDERTRAVLRGVGIAIPIVLVFGVLLASADTVFSDAISSIFGGVTNLGDLIGRLIVTCAFAWGALGIIAYGSREPFDEADADAAPRPSADTDDAEMTEAKNIVNQADTNEKAKRLPGLGMIETTIVMGSVIALFAVFVLIQFTYLFGGQANIREGVTYAQYARRGFFELVAVVVLVIGVGRYLHWQTRRHSPRETVLFRVECVALVGLTLVLLASAWYRMYLYETAYGFTHLRLYTYAFMVVLAVLLGVFLLEVITRGKTIFAFGVLLAAIGYLVVLNVINTEQFIAARNIDRYMQGEDLDICYLNTFSVDALPEMLRLLDEANEKQDEAVVTHVEFWLGSRLREIQALEAAPYAFANQNLSRMQAQDTFASISASSQWLEAPYQPCGTRFLD